MEGPQDLVANPPICQWSVRQARSNMKRSDELVSGILFVHFKLRAPYPPNKPCSQIHHLLQCDISTAALQAAFKTEVPTATEEHSIISPVGFVVGRWMIRRSSGINGFTHNHSPYTC